MLTIVFTGVLYQSVILSLYVVGVYFLPSLYYHMSLSLLKHGLRLVTNCNWGVLSFNCRSDYIYDIVEHLKPAPTNTKSAKKRPTVSLQFRVSTKKDLAIFLSVLMVIYLNTIWIVQKPWRHKKQFSFHHSVHYSFTIPYLLWEPELFWLLCDAHKAKKVRNSCPWLLKFGFTAFYGWF